MKITDVKAVFPDYKHVVPSWRTNFWQIVVRVESNVGVVGFGYGGGGIASVEIINRHLKEYVVGQEVNSVTDIAMIWDMLYNASMPYGRKGLAIMALSGVDLALFDLLGKAESKPVYDLIGGAKREKVFSYATGANSELYHKLGYKAHKFPHRWSGSEADYDTAVETADKTRDIFGPDGMLMIDTYMSWDKPVTIEMAKRLSQFRIYWYEDVLNPDDLVGQAELRSLIGDTILAGGEHEFTHYGFDNIAKTEALGIWQPDITWCGGLTAGIRIVELANKHGIPVSPHRGGEVWGLHLLVATDCADLAEFHSDHIEEKRDMLWLNEPTPNNGYISPNDNPGFGVALNEAML
ncbi:MAG: enolase C-terminal domain-like protein [Chloroflexota bacterium]|nr:enolase C-terminal domain-like protein [Chloroflexota bacterium]